MEVCSEFYYYEMFHCFGNLLKVEPPLDEDKKLLRAPFKGLTLFGDELESVYKASVERAKGITVYSANAQPSVHSRQPYMDRGRSSRSDSGSSGS